MKLIKKYLWLVFCGLVVAQPAHAISYDSTAGTYNWAETLSSASASALGTPAKSSHLIEIRDAIIDAKAQCAVVPPVWSVSEAAYLSSSLGASKPIESQQINILRQAIQNLYTAKGQTPPSALSISAVNGTRIYVSDITNMRAALDSLVSNYCGGGPPPPPPPPVCGNSICEAGEDCSGCADCACSSGFTCTSGVCVPDSCTPSCAGDCGDDGCSGSCGTCVSGESCVGGFCTPSPYTGTWTPGSCSAVCDGTIGAPSCSDSNCDPATEPPSGGACGSCPVGETCVSNACVCIPVTDCATLGCGNTDSCGTYCGDCPVTCGWAVVSGGPYCWWPPADNCGPSCSAGDSCATFSAESEFSMFGGPCAGLPGYLGIYYDCVCS